MIPKADGDATPLGQLPLCVLPVVYRIWASVRLRIWTSGSSLGFLFLCFALGVVVGLSRPGTPLLWTLRRFSGLNESHVLVFVADVVKSFDTVDRGVLDLVLGRLGLLV